MGGVATSFTLGTLMTSAAADVINHNGCKNRSIQTYAILLCKDDVGSIVEPTSSLVWAVILADFQRVISRYLQDISTYLSCTAQRVLRTILMQKYKLNYAYLPSKIVKVWIDRFCLHYDWWRRLQPTSSVSLVWSFMYANTRASQSVQCMHMVLFTIQHGLDMPCLTGMGMWLTSLNIYKL